MANVYGIRTAVIMAVAFTLLAVAVSPLIIISSRGFPGIILSIGVVITDAMLLYISIVVLTRPNYMSRFRTLALGAMSITIIAYLLFALLLIL